MPAGIPMRIDPVSVRAAEWQSEARADDGGRVLGTHHDLATGGSARYDPTPDEK